MLRKRQLKTGEPLPGRDGSARAVGLACDLFLAKRGLKQRDNFKFGGKR
jgi:hypothetical protein